MGSSVTCALVPVRQVRHPFALSLSKDERRSGQACAKGEHVRAVRFVLRQRQDEQRGRDARSDKVVRASRRDDRGFTLVETIFALGMMAFGLLTLAAVFSYGMLHLRTGASLVLAKEKAAEAIESVFMSRDTRVTTWARVRNGADGGIFLDGPQPLKLPGPDGLVNTDDDGAIEEIVLPGPDNIVGTGDDKVVPLSGFTRQIEITDISQNLREIRVTIQYPYGPSYREYMLTTYISPFA